MNNNTYRNLGLLTTNAADLRTKTRSLKNIITHLNSSIFSVQETNFRKKGRFTHDNFMIFEAIRKKEGAGSLLGVHMSLQHVLISEYSDTFELIVVEIKVTARSVRVMTGYGHQETWDMDLKMKFFLCFRRRNCKSSIRRKIYIINGRS